LHLTRRRSLATALARLPGLCATASRPLQITSSTAFVGRGNGRAASLMVREAARR